MIRRWFNKLIKAIKSWPVLKQVLRWSQRTSLPGFSRVPIFNVVQFVLREVQKDDIVMRANSIAFSLFLAIFPTIIFAFSLIPHLPLSEYYADMLNQAIESALPHSASKYLTEIVTSVASIKRQGMLSIGFALSLFFASSGVLTLMAGFDKSYDTTFKKRSYIKKRGVALFLTILLTLVFLSSIFLIIIGENSLARILNGIGVGDSALLIKLLRYLISVFVIYTGITVIYRYGPSLRRRTAFVNAGSILATVLSILTSLGFAYFINNFGRYNELYGSIGALLIILLWLQFNALVLLIGFELNAGVAVGRDTLFEIEEDLKA